jgi:acetoacetyl-CoA synthetase
MNKAIWKPNDQSIKDSLLTQFIRKINTRYNLKLNQFNHIYQWSIKHTDEFWKSVWSFTTIISSAPATITHEKKQRLTDHRWFVGSRLNYAENLLHHQHDGAAIIEINEDGVSKQLTQKELTIEVNRLSHHWRQQGVKAGDRIVAMLANDRYAIIALLAAASIGAVWSCCAPDFGLDNLIDRFSQIKPTILVVVENHQYKGKIHCHRDKIKALQAHLKPQKTLMITNSSSNDINLRYTNTERFQDIPDTQEPLSFTALPFDHPLAILFSSGTTGKPKCIIHSAGGTLIQHVKEHQLHCDIKPSDRVFFYTTTGWMMWNWLVSALASKATIILFDGCPTYQRSDQLFSLIDEHQITHFGVSAKYIELCQKAQCHLKQEFHLSSLRTILSTGSPLLPKAFDYIYESVKSDVCLSSISGGTDIVSCFALGNPLSPVYRGEIQGRGLGMAIEIFNDQGDPITGEKGELVCTQAFPSMPIGFYNDPEQEKYLGAYFKSYENVWAHQDYASLNNHGGVIIYGRSDATLNPGGIRIGTAEIYRQIDKIQKIVEAMAIGYPIDSDEKVILFVVLKADQDLTEKLDKKIKQTLRENASVHHVPYQIIKTPELPRTLNGKLAESTVKRILLNQPIDNELALANPQSIEFFSQCKINQR